MNYRIAYTVALSIGISCLIITGVLMYSTEYDYFTSGLHLWSSILVLVAVAGHIKSNWAPYKNHLKKKIGKFVFIFFTVGLIPVSWGLVSEMTPFVTLVALGENLRGASEVREGAYKTIDLAPDLDDDNKLSLFIKAGREYESEPQPLYWGLTYTSTPQIAVWLEDMQGNYLQTLYVTGKVAQSGFYSAKEDEGRVRRPETLPYWSHKRGVKASDGLYVPEEDSTAFDGRTAATPKSDHLLQLAGTNLDGKRLMVEVNRSYDFNEYYSKDRFPDDAIYSGSGSSGQPSLIYSAKLQAKNKKQFFLELIGHGHHSGQNGKLYANTNNITTAKEIVSFMVASLN